MRDQTTLLPAFPEELVSSDRPIQIPTNQLGRMQRRSERGEEKDTEESKILHNFTAVCIASIRSGLDESR